MKKIDTKDWKKFRIDDIFNINNTKSIIQKNIIPDSGSVPYVTSQAGNNGVLTYIDCPEEWKEDGNCIMIGGKTMTFSYQEKSFCSNDSHNIVLYLKNNIKVSKMCYLFLVTALRSALSNKYSWSDSISMKRIKKDNLLLPITDIGEPNWQYMESFMSKIYKSSIKDLFPKLQIINKHEPITTNLSNWKQFSLYDDYLFDIDMGTKLDKAKMHENNPTVNFVGRANANNGVTAFVDRIDGIEPYKAGYMTLSLGGEYLGSCFIQDKPFYTSQNVIVLKPKHKMSNYVKHFIASIIFRESRLHYKAFDNELNRHIKTDFKIYLPVTKDGEPDWHYMEKFMQNINKKSEEQIKILYSII